MAPGSRIRAEMGKAGRPGPEHGFGLRHGGEGLFQVYTLYPEWVTARGRPDSPDIFVRGGLGTVCGSNAR